MHGMIFWITNDTFLYYIQALTLVVYILEDKIKKGKGKCHCLMGKFDVIRNEENNIETTC
jgi:hypothetical protein